MCRERDDGNIGGSSAALTRRVASQPSMTGRLMSIKIRSGVSLCAIATACSPSTAMTTSYPLRSRRRESMSRFISLSSTNKIFAIKSPSHHRFTSTLRSISARAGRRPTALPIAAAISLSIESPFSITVRTAEKAPLGRRQLLGRDDHHRHMTPVGAAVERIKKLKAVHLRHHQVEQDQARVQGFLPARKAPAVRWSPLRRSGPSSRLY